MFGWNQSLWFSVLLGAAFKSTLVLGAAWLIACLLRGRSAAARHLVWTAAAAAVLAMPFLSVSLPELTVRAPRAFQSLNTGLVFRVVSAVDDGAAQPAAISANTRAPSNGAPRRPDATIFLSLIWAAGTLALLAQMLLASAALCRMRRAARPFPDRGLARELARVLGIPHPVRILETAPGGMPMTFGLRRPVIFMPSGAGEWTAERRRVVLLHELAHIRRGDFATHLIARGALALHWWNPLAWIAWRGFLKERERAADDLVLNAGAPAPEYAGHLLEVARSLQSAPASAWAAVSMARRSQIEGRLLAILDSRVNRNQPGRAAPLLAVIIAVLLAAPFAAMRAQSKPDQASPPEIDATVRAANAQKNHEILEHAAAAYENLKKYDIAKTLLENALAIRGQVSGERSAAYAAGLVKIGDLEIKRGKFGEAESFYAKAAALGDRPEIAPALLYLGRSAFGRRDHAAAFDLFQRAVNVAPAGPQAGPAMTWMAMARQSEPGGAGEAESLYQRALSIEDPKSADAATTMELYARFLRDQNRAGDAEVMEARSQVVRQARAREMVKDLAQSSNVYRVGGGVTSPALLRKLEPSYTEEARAAKLAGTVLLSVEIGPDGLARNIRIVKGIGLGLDEKAIEAITQWLFKPGTKDGQPVTVAATIEVNFRLM